MGVLTERWVPIAGYEGRYEVSDHGRIRSMSRWRRGKSGCMVPVQGRMMRLREKKRTSSGRTLPYKEVQLCDGSKRTIPCKSFLVHRLVAQAFIGELFEGCHVDHIDGTHGNNHWSNLRILSALEHGRLHPCITSKERNQKMQEAAQNKIKIMRESGEIVGKYLAKQRIKDRNC